MAGSATSTTEIPQYLNEAGARAIRRGEEVGKIGYVPYYGPDVAAFTPSQNAAFDNTNAAAGAFGMAQGQNRMPQATRFSGGIQGYSSGDLYDQAMAQSWRENPGQTGLLNSFFYDADSKKAWKKKGAQAHNSAVQATRKNGGK